jgi:hypothetical protein
VVILFLMDESCLLYRMVAVAYLTINLAFDAAGRSSRGETIESILLASTAMLWCIFSSTTMITLMILAGAQQNTEVLYTISAMRELMVRPGVYTCVCLGVAGSTFTCMCGSRLRVRRCTGTLCG